MFQLYLSTAWTCRVTHGIVMPVRTETTLRIRIRHSHKTERKLPQGGMA
jgi:hypothetical protein